MILPAQYSPRDLLAHAVAKCDAALTYAHYEVEAAKSHARALEEFSDARIAAAEQKLEREREAYAAAAQALRAFNVRGT